MNKKNATLEMYQIENILENSRIIEVYRDYFYSTLH